MPCHSIIPNALIETLEANKDSFEGTLELALETNMDPRNARRWIKKFYSANVIRKEPMNNKGGRGRKTRYFLLRARSTEEGQNEH